MADYKLNPTPPVEVLKEDLVIFVLDLGIICNQINQVQRSLPYGTGNIEFKRRLDICLKSTQNLLAFFNSEYLP